MIFIVVRWAKEFDSFSVGPPVGEVLLSRLTTLKHVFDFFHDRKSTLPILQSCNLSISLNKAVNGNVHCSGMTEWDEK